jgi:glycosyltransferase involved in cell wall biosynthesis
MKPKIIYCILTLNRLHRLKKAVKRVAPWVDRTIVVDGFSTDGTVEWLQGDECRELGVEWNLIEQHLYQYGNHNPDKRNPYIRLAGDEGWILVMDDDEYLYEDACRNLYSLAMDAEEHGCDGVMFKPHDLWYKEDGSILRDIKHTDYWSPMFWKIYPGQKYVGHTHVRIERPGAIDRWIKTDYYYEHVKTERRMWQNSTQNYWTTVGLATNNTDDKTWLDFHELMDYNGFKDWHKFHEVMKLGHIPYSIKDWFIEHRNAENPEEASWFVYYFNFLHPAENVDNLTSGWL